MTAQQVQTQLRKQQAALVTTEFVFLEVADALCAPQLRQKTVSALTRLRQLKSLQIVPLNQALYDRGWELYAQRQDKGWV